MVSTEVTMGFAEVSLMEKDTISPAKVKLMTMEHIQKSLSNAEVWPSTT